MAKRKSGKRIETPLEAVEAGDLDRLRELIAQGADVDEFEEETALAKAAELGSEPMVKELLKAGANVNFGGLVVPLCRAASSGNVKVVTLLLDAGAKVDAQEEDGITALMFAASGGHLDIVKMLIKAGADPKVVGSDGESALLMAGKHPEIVKVLKPLSLREHMEYLDRQAQQPDRRVEELIAAAGAGKVAAVRKLLAEGVPVNGSTPHQQTALLAAAEAGHLNVVEATLEAGATVDLPNEYGRTPLWEAAHAGHARVAERLLAAGADLNARDTIEGKNPFLAAIGRDKGRRETLQLLARHGADLEAADQYGRTALALADRDLGRGDADSKALRELFVSLGIVAADAGKLTAAAGKGDLQTVTRLIEAGTPPDAIDEQERTALYMAVSRRQPEVVAYLLKAGADPSKPIGRDDEADVQCGGVELPCPKCKTPFISMVVPRQCPKCGKRFDARKTSGIKTLNLPLYVSWCNGFMPLMAAAKLNDAKLARILIDAGAKVNRGNGEITPLMCACHFGHLEVAKALIEKGADVRKVAKEPGRVGNKVTAVEIAAKGKHLELVKLLWDAGVPAKGKNQTLLIDAAQRGDTKAMRALLAADADPNKPDPLTGEMPLNSAAEAGQPDAVAALIQAGALVAQSASRQFPPLVIIAEKFQRGWVAKPDVERYLATARKLLDAGARATVTVFGITPLSLAKESKCKPLIEMLSMAAEQEKPATKQKR